MVITNCNDTLEVILSDWRDIRYITQFGQLAWVCNEGGTAQQLALSALSGNLIPRGVDKFLG